MKKMIKAMCCAVEHDGNDIKPLSGINQISYRCSPRPLAAVIRLVSINWKFTKKKSQWLYFRHHNDSSKKLDLRHFPLRVLTSVFILCKMKLNMRASI